MYWVPVQEIAGIPKITNRNSNFLALQKSEFQKKQTGIFRIVNKIGIPPLIGVPEIGTKNWNSQPSILATSWHWPWCGSRCDIARIVDFFAERIEFLAEGGGRERCIKMGFGRHGAGVSPWLVPFFWVLLLFDFMSVGGGKGGRNLPTGPPI